MCPILQVQFRLVRETGGARKLVALRDLNPGELIFSEAIIDIYLIFVGTSLKIQRHLSLKEGSQSRRAHLLGGNNRSRSHYCPKLKDIDRWNRCQISGSSGKWSGRQGRNMHHLLQHLHWPLQKVLKDSKSGGYSWFSQMLSLANMQLNTVKYYQMLSSTI